MIRSPFRNSLAITGLALWAFLALGCTPDSEPTAPPPDAPPRQPEKPAPVKKVQVAKNIVLEIQGDKRRVVVNASICLQKGQLEQLMTLKNTKEHEAVLTADIDGRMLKQALLLTGAKEGKPVKFDPKYQPATGQTIKITVEYMEKGQLVTRDAREWVRNSNTKATLPHHWVFAGSRLIPNPLNQNKLIFLANDGDLVCVSNFDTALLDLPINSPKDAAALVWEANTEKIPAVETQVTVIFEPVPAKK